jgi:hypothetical protein
MLELERIGYERFQSGISYNWAIDMQTGMIGEGMPLLARGTHTVNDKNVAGFPNQLNEYGHAIVAIGMPGNHVSNKFVLSFAAIMAAEQELAYMETNAPIYPHSKFANKDCPTEAVRSKIPLIRATVGQVGKVYDMKFTDPVGDYKDPDGSDLTVGEALVRGNVAYMIQTGQHEEYKKANKED